MSLTVEDAKSLILLNKKIKRLERELEVAHLNAADLALDVKVLLPVANELIQAWEIITLLEGQCDPDTVVDLSGLEGAYQMAVDAKTDLQVRGRL